MAVVTLAVFCSHLECIIGNDGRALVQLATEIERAGADQLVLSEHVVLSAVIEAHGPGGLPFPFPPDHPYPEPLVTLAAMATATSRIRLATGILIAPLRPAVVLAKMAATVDWLSGGRLDLGVGAGWHRAELLAAGVDPGHLNELLDDTVAACRALWGGGPATYESDHVRFRDLFCVPAPPQGSRLPVWFAGPPVRSTFERIVRLGAGWVPFGNLGVDDIAKGRALMTDCARQAGRIPEHFGIRASLPVANDPDLAERLARALDAAPAYLAAGATVLQIPLHRLVTTLDDVNHVVATAANAIGDLRGKHG
jgi:probable F420-dependent oxidoreductase